MREIDLATWARREHFEFFRTFNHPHFSMCVNVDLTKFLPYIKNRGVSFTAAVIYVISRTANDLPEFRQRIRQETVVEHELVSPSVTILLKNELFSFCSIDYGEDFLEFSGRATQMIARIKENPSLKDPPGRDDVLFMTSIPWVSFTSFNHPMRLHPADSIPRFAWGKYFEEAGKIKMPLSVQGHHALLDGIHLGKYYGILAGYLERPEVYFDSK